MLNSKNVSRDGSSDVCSSDLLKNITDWVGKSGYLFNALRHTAVSYTHLDVYKRQALNPPARTTILIITLSPVKYIDNYSVNNSLFSEHKAVHTTMPVSYTHLDVYKRQGDFKRNSLFEYCGDLISRVLSQ